MGDSADIAATFLINAPPGEYEQCSVALSCIVSDPSLIETIRERTIEKWNQKNYTLVKVNDQKAIICAEAQRDDGTYLEPTTNTTFTYDFNQRVATQVGKGPETSELRNTIQEKMNTYAADYYKDDAAAGVYEGVDGSITIILRSSSVSLQNFRTGSVYARYVLTNTGELTGRIEAQQHFFESGNAVCQYGADLNESITMGDPSAVASSLVRKITNFESKWLDSYKDALLLLGDEGIFKLRRKTTVSRQRINWQAELTTGGGMITK